MRYRVLSGTANKGVLFSRLERVATDLPIVICPTSIYIPEVHYPGKQEVT
ncbi:MAG: hypothetical protein HQL69_12440 [Magnetococcales bacterium]|nr:hypothetical protein [Magnetococcales bacterium]